MTRELPDGLAALVTRCLGPITAIADRSWARPGSNVWEVFGHGSACYAKQHITGRFHAREVAAYRTWVPLLGEDAPALLAQDAAVPGIVVTSVPGIPVKLQTVTPREEVRVHTLAGALARRIHNASPAPGLVSPGVPLEAAAKHLARTVLTGPRPRPRPRAARGRRRGSAPRGGDARRLPASQLAAHTGRGPSAGDRLRTR